MSLKERAEALHAQQTAAVKLMHDNFAALEKVESRTMLLGGMEVRAVHNPARAVSSGARVDKASVMARPCFLCASNRLQGQESVECLGGRYEILVNPYPIFSRHFVIASRDHERQSIHGRVTDMWELAHELEGYTVFYNGPRCGASAPDHQHFQAVPSEALPLWKALGSAATDMPIDVAVTDAASAVAAEGFIESLIATLPGGDTDEWEPRMNVLATSTGDGVRIAVVPRRRHRPTTYTGDPTDDNGLMISPGAVDAAGVMVIVRRIDFERIDEATLRTIYNETCRR